MTIFKQCGKLSCGINADGKLFIGDDHSGSTIEDTKENRRRIMELFEKYKAFYEEV